MEFGKKDIYGALTVYRELAYYICRREEYERALKFFDEALDRAPTDKRALTGRAWARAKACHYDGAIEDIKKALNADPEDLIIIAQKALNTYLCCNFEDALVLNLRMVPARKKPDNFVMGVMHCTEAIENGIGTRAGRPLRDHFKIIRKIAWKKAREVDKPFEPKTRYKKKKKKKKDAKKTKVHEPVVPLIKSRTSKSAKSVAGSIYSGQSKFAGPEMELKSINLDTVSAVSGATQGNDLGDLYIHDSLHTLKTESDFIPPGKPFPFRPMQRYTTNIENYMSEKYLDSMYLDKMFLKGLKRNLGVKSPNAEGTKKVLAMSKEGYKTLAYKQELLRTRRPFYFIKFQEAKLSGALKERILAELRKMQNAATKDADALLYKIKSAVSERKTQIALETAEKLKVFCDLKPKKVLPAREEYLEQMYRLVARAYYLLFRINENQYEFIQNRRIFNWLGMPRSREPSTDSVINQFKGIFTDWKKQIVVFEERLRKATSSEEMAWIYHELARYHSETKQYELARVYARKCIQEAREANDVNWVINAMMMLSRVYVQQHNRNDAKFQLNETMALAKLIGDQTLIKYIQKFQQLVEETDFADQYGAKVLEKRERQIIQMMAGSGMKDEVAFLFRKMGVMPATRRMSVMPGVKLEDTEQPSAAARKASIMPGSKQSTSEGTPRAMRMASTKSTDKSEGKEGIGFMELIKYHVD